MKPIIKLNATLTQQLLQLVDKLKNQTKKSATNITQIKKVEK